MAAHLGRHFTSVQSWMKRHGLYQLRNSVKRRNAMPLQSLEPLGLAYLAGIVDGEGTITIRRIYNKKLGKTYYNPFLLVNNTSGLLMEWLKLRGFLCHLYTSTSGTPCWKMSLGGVQAGEACKLLLPYLVIKAPQAKLLIAFRDLRDAQRMQDKPTPQMLQMYREVRRLNMRFARPIECRSKPAPSTTIS